MLNHVCSFTSHSHAQPGYMSPSPCLSVSLWFAQLFAATDTMGWGPEAARVPHRALLAAVVLEALRGKRTNAADSRSENQPTIL